MLKTTQKIIFAIFIFISLFGFLSPALAQNPPPDEKPKGPVLELAYPIIPGEISPQKMKEGLPEFVKYIYSLAMILIGLIIFGILIYNGILWFTSAGNADKLKTAKEGITAAFLGALILFSAYIVFKTINPQLTILQLENPEAVEPKVFAGIYLCNYDLDQNYFQNVLNDYMHGEENEADKKIRIEATKKFKEIMDNEKGRCYRLNSSDAFLSGSSTPAFSPKGTQNQNKDSVFQIPEKSYTLEDGNILIQWSYEYGVIFHKKDQMRGQCRIFLYGNDYPNGTQDIHPELGFNTAFSVTVFRRPFIEAAPEDRGIILYECLDYNDDPTLCHRIIEDKNFAHFGSFKTEGKDYNAVNTSWLDNAGLINEDTGNSEVRSIRIEPEDHYFAAMFDSENANGECGIITKSDNNLLDHPIGQCGIDCNRVIQDSNTSKTEKLLKCFPCAKAIMAIKGVVL